MSDEYTPPGTTIAFTVPSGEEVIDGPNAFKAFCDDVGAAVQDAIDSIPVVSFDVGVLNKTASYQPVAADANKAIVMNAAGSTVITLPSDTAEPGMNIGSTIIGVRLGAGAVAFAAGSGATVVSTPGLNLRATNSLASALKIAANTWIVTGDLA